MGSNFSNDLALKLVVAKGLVTPIGRKLLLTSMILFMVLNLLPDFLELINDIQIISKTYKI